VVVVVVVVVVVAGAGGAGASAGFTSSLVVVVVVCDFCLQPTPIETKLTIITTTSKRKIHFFISLHLLSD
jgi:hypothetical protein